MEITTIGTEGHVVNKTLGFKVILEFTEIKQPDRYKIYVFSNMD